MKSEFIPPHPLNTAVLFLVFNRPDTTKQVFEAIRKAKPPRLYVAADGHRTDRPGEEEKVKAVREFVMDSIDWSCEVNTLFRDSNLGCKYAVSGAITWFFEHEEMGIILEDDCLPSQSFFWFCEELLERYRDDYRVGMISGRNPLGAYNVGNMCSYFFTSRGFIWGWATWRRVALDYDVELGSKKKPVNKYQLYKASTSLVEYLYRKKNIEAITKESVNTWGYPWNINLLLNSKLAILPCKNMVVNIGFGDDATHTNSCKKDDVLKHEIELSALKSGTDNITIDYNFSKKTIVQAMGGSPLRFLLSTVWPLNHIKSVIKMFGVGLKRCIL